MHSVNSDMQVFALLESQFMDVHKEPKSTRKSSDTTNVHTSEYLCRGPFVLTGMKVLRGFYTPFHKSRRAKSHILQFLHA